ncbi:unnamed protein product [Symbiodinium microadriaticum]|nr:unnamed protein product [Symbiodinium microadriaticum]
MYYYPPSRSHIQLPGTKSGEQGTPSGVCATWDGLLQCVAMVPGLDEYTEKYGEELKQTNMADFVKCREFLRKYRSVEHVDASDIDQDPSIFLTPRRFTGRSAQWLTSVSCCGHGLGQVTSVRGMATQETKGVKRVAPNS